MSFKNYIYFYPELFEKSINAFSKYYETNYFYNSIYINSFLNAIKEIKQKDKKMKDNQMEISY